MPKNLHRLKLFASFASDMEPYVQRLKQVVSRRNPDWEARDSVTIRVSTFQDIESTYNPNGGQDTINQEFFGKFDIYLGLMGSRFGRPTNHYGSGTEEEYRLAIDMFNKGMSVKIMFGFASVPLDPFSIDVGRLKAAQEFKSSISTAQLYFSWTSDVDFDGKIENQLNILVGKIANDPNFMVRGGARYG